MSEREVLLPVRYYLEIYEPGATHRKGSVCATFDASTPFMAIHVGDVLLPDFWPDAPDSMTKPVRVRKVEHILWDHVSPEDVPEERAGPAQKICIWTEDE